jgi:hypothetical protein
VDQIKITRQIFSCAWVVIGARRCRQADLDAADARSLNPIDPVESAR